MSRIIFKTLILLFFTLSISSQSEAKVSLSDAARQAACGFIEVGGIDYGAIPDEAFESKKFPKYLEWKASTSSVGGKELYPFDPSGVKASAHNPMCALYHLQQLESSANRAGLNVDKTVKNFCEAKPFNQNFLRTHFAPEGSSSAGSGSSYGALGGATKASGSTGARVEKCNTGGEKVKFVCELDRFNRGYRLNPTRQTEAAEDLKARCVSAGADMNIRMSQREFDRFGGSLCGAGVPVIVQPHWGNQAIDVVGSIAKTGLLGWFAYKGLKSNHSVIKHVSDNHTSLGFSSGTGTGGALGCGGGYSRTGGYSCGAAYNGYCGAPPYTTCRGSAGQGAWGYGQINGGINGGGRYPGAYYPGSQNGGYYPGGPNGGYYPGGQNGSWHGNRQPGGYDTNALDRQAKLIDEYYRRERQRIQKQKSTAELLKQQQKDLQDVQQKYQETWAVYDQYSQPAYNPGQYLYGGGQSGGGSGYLCQSAYCQPGGGQYAPHYGGNGGDGWSINVGGYYQSGT